jgi:hypothetical protein
MYGYNGNEIDQGEVYAYGENPPAQGFMFLNQKMSAFVYHNNLNNNPMGDPDNAPGYYRLLQAIWKDGTPMTMWGTGYNPEGGERAHFMFSGDPIAKTGWTEYTPYGPGSEPNYPNDRRGLMSAGPFMFPAGSSLSFDIALPFVWDNGSKSNLSSLALLKDFAVEIQALCQRGEIRPIKGDPLPKDMIAYILRDRVAPVEMELEAYQTGRKEFLEELVLMDKWATSVKQVRGFIDEILNLPYHAEMKDHYR